MTFLLGKPSKAKSISHPYGKFESISEQEANKLMNRLSDGDNSVRDTIIRGHIRLAMSVAGKYAALKKYLEDELFSESLFAMNKVLDRISNGEHLTDNLTLYLVGAMHIRCGNLVREDRLLGACNKTRYNHRKQGIDIPDPQVFSMSTSDQVRSRSISTDFGSDSESYRRQPSFLDSVTVPSEVPYLDLKEALYACIQTNQQLRIINMRIAGHNVRAIADAVGVSKSTVSNELAVIRSLLQEYLDG